MKKIIILLITVLILSMPISASEIDDFYAWYTEEYAQELDMMSDLLAEHELEWGTCIGGEAENIESSNFIRSYNFNCDNIVKGYKEKNCISELITENYDYFYFGQEFHDIAIFKKTDGQWRHVIDQVEKQDPDEEKNYYIKDMIKNVLIEHPDLDYGSLKFIEHGYTGTIYIYFTDNDVEYLATYPYADDNDSSTKPSYGDIYKPEELMEILEPRFANVKPLEEGEYGGGISDAEEGGGIPTYVYFIGAGVVVVLAAITITVIKKRKQATYKA